MAIKNLYNKKTSPQRVVILGKGFVGNSLYKRLIKEKINVLVISKKDLDLTQKNASDELVNILKPTDAVIFTSTITPSKGKGIDAFTKNIKIAESVCKALEKVEISHLIYLSSDAVYPLEIDIISEHTTANPADLYGIMHLSREYMLKQVAKCPLAILRSTLIYGLEDPHNSYGPNRLRRMAKETNKIKLFGKGEEKRDHIYIDDVVSLILCIVFYKSSGLLNIATGNTISYDEVAKKISSLYEKDIQIEYSERKNKIIHRHFDASLIFEVFPFFSFTSIEEGLKLIYQNEINQ